MGLERILRQQTMRCDFISIYIGFVHKVSFHFRIQIQGKIL